MRAFPDVELLFARPVLTLIEFHVASVAHSRDPVVVSFDALALVVAQLIAVRWHDVPGAVPTATHKALRCVMDMVEQLAAAVVQTAHLNSEIWLSSSRHLCSSDLM